MTPTNTFEEIRPYNDAEFCRIYPEILSHPWFSEILRFLFGPENVASRKALYAQAQTIHDFQYGFGKDVTCQLINEYMKEFSYHISEKISADQACLFFANHRDIAMDSMFLQYILVKQGLPPCEISFGDNLMTHPFVIHLGKSIQMYKIIRKGLLREQLQNAKHLSAYLHTRISKENKSCWIAQRNGRTKDGNDLSDTAVLKMLSYGGSDIVNAFSSLRLTPVVISYEYEPCDDLKARELYFLQSRGTYVKQENEDLQSIIQGILQPKGRVHMEILSPLEREDLLQIKNPLSLAALGEYIDNKIHAAYRLWENHYIAYDLLAQEHGKKPQYTDKYSTTQKDNFVNYMHQKLSKHADIENPELLRDIFLRIYGNGVGCKLS